jgi:hypothetical protein
MYEFVDRPLARQPESVRLLVWAMRRWARAAQDGHRVCGLIAGAFSASSVAKGAPPFTAAMRILVGNALVPLRFGAVCDPLIAEHEAVLLSALSAAGDRRTEPCRAIARHLVLADRASGLAWSLIRVAEEFSGAGIMLSGADQSARPEPPAP